MKKLHILILGLVLSSAFALIGANSASALYGSFHTTERLNVVSPDGLQSADVSQEGPNSWTDIRTDTSTLRTCAYQSELTVALESGSISVIQQTPQPTGNQGYYSYLDYSWGSGRPKSFVYIIFSTSASQNGNVIIGDDYTDVLAQTTYNSSHYFAALYIDNDGNYIFNCNQFNYSTCSDNPTTHQSTCAPIIDRSYIGYSGTGWGYPDFQTYIYYTTYDIEYPSDWDQPEIPTDSPPPPITSLDVDYFINFTITNTTQILTAKYVNKKTDPVTSLSDPKRIQWDLMQDFAYFGDGGTNVCQADLLTSVTFDTTVHCPDLVIDNSKEYYLLARVNPIDNPDISREGYIITFKIAVFKIDFTKNNAGTTENCEPGALGPNQSIYCLAPETIDFTQCFTDSFPFVDPFECADNFTLIFNLIAFGNINIPSFNFDPACRNLVTLDEWLLLPSGYQVCPQFPPAVRNIVTPFVFFMLGIVTIGFINRHNRDVRGQGF